MVIMTLWQLSDSLLRTSREEMWVFLFSCAFLTSSLVSNDSSMVIRWWNLASVLFWETNQTVNYHVDVTSANHISQSSGSCHREAVEFQFCSSKRTERPACFGENTTVTEKRACPSLDESSSSSLSTCSDLMFGVLVSVWSQPGSNN